MSGLIGRGMVQAKNTPIYTGPAFIPVSNSQFSSAYGVIGWPGNYNDTYVAWLDPVTANFEIQLRMETGYADGVVIFKFAADTVANISNYECRLTQVYITHYDLNGISGTTNTNSALGVWYPMDNINTRFQWGGVCRYGYFREMLFEVRRISTGEIFERVVYFNLRGAGYFPGS